jgi:hypothetical protein
MRIAIRELVAAGLLAAGLSAAAVSAHQQDKPATPPAPAAQTPAPATAEHEHEHGSARPAFDSDKALAELQKQIAGKEDQPAEKVFMNVEMFKGVPAGRLLRAMGGISNAVGANCATCHNPAKWESDEKHEKVAARGMMRMTRDINDKYIKGMQGLDDDAHVSCGTCHRGHLHPEEEHH